MNAPEEEKSRPIEEEKVPDNRTRLLWEQRLWISWKRLSKRTRRYTAALLIWAILAAVGPCTITHQYGPYYGKIVDAETGEPLEGAVVFVAYYTELHTPAGRMSRLVDASEVLTNANGEFRIPSYRAWVFRAPHSWDVNAEFIVFKIGYGYFPHDQKITPKFNPSYSIPSNKHTTLKLHKITTQYDAEENLYYLPPLGIPDDKIFNLLNQIDIEKSRYLNNYYDK